MLVRIGEPSTGRPGYVPVDIKHHKAIDDGGKAATVTVSSWSAPGPSDAETLIGRRPRFAKRESDVLQLAHYWRMLESQNWHADVRPIGAICGTDTIPGCDEYPIVWFPLDERNYETFSRSRGKARRTALERYDHEYRFRLRIAETAAMRSGSKDDPEPLVLPIYQTECEQCQWHDWCVPRLVSHPSWELRGLLSRREWATLGQLGIDTIGALAQLDVVVMTDSRQGESETSALLDLYLPEVAHLSDATKRLAKAVDRARMVLDGVEVRRTTEGRIPVGRGRIEVDLDAEWDDQNRVYLWGVLVTGADRGGAAYRPFSHWGPSDPRAETFLGKQLLGCLLDLRRQASELGGELKVFHYTAAEVTHLRRVIASLNRWDEPLRKQALALIDTCFVDLHRIVSSHLTGVHGLGLKRVATSVGFSWRDDNPGGDESQVWLGRARSSVNRDGARAMQRRILEYNEDDVRATAYVREWLRRQS